MTAEELAELLNGRPMGDEMTTDEEALAKTDGLLIVFGYSDDNAELRGVVSDEVGCYNGWSFVVDSLGVRKAWDEDEPISESDARDFFEREDLSAVTITAVWHDGGDGPCWTYETDTDDVARFMILEDGDPFCEGIVFPFPPL